MTAKPEHLFPTIAEMRDELSTLINEGLGGLPVQVLVVPDATMQAIARHSGHQGDQPAFMVELGTPQRRDQLPVSLISAERLAKGSQPYRKVQ